MLWLIGFSTYTSFPAWQAQIVMSACQWSGAAIVTASMSRLSRTRRKSVSGFGSPPHFSFMKGSDVVKCRSSISTT